MTICQSRNGELRKGMMRTWGISVGTRGIRKGTRGGKVGMQWIRVGTQGIRMGTWGTKVGVQGIRVEMQEIRMGMRGMGVGMRVIRVGTRRINHGNSSWESPSLLLRLKSLSVRGAFHLPAFMGRCPTISHALFAFCTSWIRSPWRKWGREVSPRFHLLVFVFDVNQ